MDILRAVANIRMGNLLLGYLALYFLFPYKPFGLILSPHSILLLFGVLVLSFRSLREYKSVVNGLSLENYVFFGMVMFFVASMFVHLPYFPRVGFPAYFFSFLCYLFVRSSAHEINLSKFYNLMGWYLIVSGLLIFFQVNISDVFYVSQYFESGDIAPAHQGWGFANFHVVSGGIMMWGLAVSVAHFADGGSQKKGVWKDLFGLVACVLGAIGLYYSSSRAAWLGVLVSFAVLSVISLRSKRAILRLTIAFLIPFASVLVCEHFLPSKAYRLTDKLMFFRKAAVTPLAAVNSDVSSKTKLKAWALAVDVIKQNPVWGIGIDQFPKYYETAYSGLDTVKEGIDPEMNINASNSFLSYMAEVGGVPAAFLFFLIALVFYKSVTSGFSSANIPLLIGFIAICFWAIPADYLKERTFWISFGMLSSLVATRNISEHS